MKSGGGVALIHQAFNISFRGVGPALPCPALPRCFSRTRPPRLPPRLAGRGKPGGHAINEIRGAWRVLASAGDHEHKLPHSLLRDRVDDHCYLRSLGLEPPPFVISLTLRSGGPGAALRNTLHHPASLGVVRRCDGAAAVVAVVAAESSQPASRPVGLQPGLQPGALRCRKPIII